MKTRMLILSVLIAICMLSLSSCVAEYGGSDTADSNEKIQTDFVQIPGEENLYYSKSTKIVYWIGGSYTINMIGDDYTTSYMTVWYAENGLPYRYNTTTRQLEMIES